MPGSDAAVGPVSHCTYLAHHELESVIIVVIIMLIIIIIMTIIIYYKCGVLVQCLAQMQQSGLSAIAITDGTDSNQLIGNFSVSDLR